MIPYLQPGAALTAANWRAAFQAADATLTTALGGLSAVLARLDKQWDRCFFFFDPTSLPAGLHPVAAHFFSSASYGPPNQPALFYRLYNDSPVATAVAACTVSATSTKFGTAKLTLPTWSSWSSVIYPSGFGSQSTNGLYSGTTPALNILDVSLAVQTVAVSSVNYAVTFSDVTMAEHAQPYKPIDVFINAAFTWSSTWNKYSLVRIHNCGQAAYTVTFGGASQSLAAGASLCVRKLASGWVICGNYFHWMESSDARFLQCQEATGGAASIMQPGLVADVLQAVLAESTSAGTSNLGGYFDGTQFWSMVAVYNNASYSPDAYENTPPSGGYLPALAMSALLGDLIVHRGKVLVANRLLAPTRTPAAFAGFGSLASVLSAAGMSSRALSQTVSSGYGGGTVTNLEIYWNSTGAQDLIDLSSPLVTFITGSPASNIGSTQTSSPKSIILPWLYFNAVAVVNNPSSSNVSFYNWATDGNGNPYTTSMVTVTVNNAGSTASVSNKVFLPTNSANDAWTWMNGISTAGGILGMANAAVLSTPFGPILTWQETWPLNAQFNSISTLGNAPIASVKLQYGIGLVVTRTRFLGDGFNIWPPRTASATFMQWNFARVNQKIAFSRFFLHGTSDAPMMPNWSSYLSSNYAWLKYYPPSTAFDVPISPYGDNLSSNEFWAVQSFYESAPISQDTTLVPAIHDVPGLARTGPFSWAGNLWPVFANWFNSLGNFTYNIPPDAGGTTSIGVSTTNSYATDWYNNNDGSIVPNAAAAPTLADGTTPAWRNVLMCQAEHFNLLASLINAEPPMKYLLSPTGGVYFTLNFAAGNILIVAGGSGYAVNDTLAPYNLIVSAVGTGGVVTAVAQSGSAVVSTYSAYGTPVRPFTTTTSGSGSGCTLDTSSGSGTGLSFIPTWNPTGVPIPSGSPVTGTLWPRTAFFAWNGATPGGADPVAIYITALAFTVQTTLPDGYGAAVVDQFVFQGVINTTNNPVPLSPPATSYYGGFNPAFAVSAGAYRWINIAQARSFYALWSLPFVLSGVYAPMTWAVENSYSASSTVSVTNGGPTGLGGPQPGPGAATSSPGGWAYYTIAGFYNAAGGNWLATPLSYNLMAQITPPTPVTPTGFYTTVAYSNFTNIPYGIGAGNYWTRTENDYFITLVPGPLWAEAASFGVPVAYTSLAILAEGLPTQLAAAIPQNYSFYDPNWAPAHASVYQALGTGVIPIIADNTVEGDQAETTLFPGTGGAGGAGLYDHVITTSLANARLITLPIDGTIGSPPSTGAGNSSSGGL